MSEKSRAIKYRIVGTGIDKKWKGGPNLFPELLVIRAKSLKTEEVIPIHVPMNGCKTIQDARNFLASHYPHGSILRATWIPPSVLKRRC